MTLLIALLLASTPVASPRTDLDTAIRRYDEAQVASDKAALEMLLADDYLLVNSAGEIENKRQFIADQIAAGYKLERFTVVHPIQRRWHDGAIIGGVAPLKGLSGGKPFSVCLRFADIWRQSGGRWQVAYTQAARAKPAECGEKGR